MTKKEKEIMREIEDKYFGNSILSKIKLTEEESSHAVEIILSKPTLSKEVKARLDTCRDFFQNFKAA